MCGWMGHALWERDSACLCGSRARTPSKTVFEPVFLACPCLPSGDYGAGYSLVAWAGAYMVSDPPFFLVLVVVSGLLRELLQACELCCFVIDLVLAISSLRAVVYNVQFIGSQSLSSLAHTNNHESSVLILRYAPSLSIAKSFRSLNFGIRLMTSAVWKSLTRVCRI